MREKRWEDTVLGPVDGWPGPLVAAVRMLLTSRFAMWMGWGDELTVFYNDAYRTDTLGSKHPWALGRPAHEVWREIWPEIGPRIASVIAGGRATWDEGLLLMLERSGYSEETYHTFSYSPLHEDDGRVGGFLCVVTEDTGRMISERRVGLLGKLAAETAGAKTTDDVLAGLARCLASDARDLPFTLTYLFDDDGDPASGGAAKLQDDRARPKVARLVAHTGFADAPAELARDVGLDGDPVWRLGELVETGHSLELAIDAAHAPALAWPTGPWSLAPSRVFVVPIAQPGQLRLAGALVAAISPHRAFDAAYRQFVTLVVGQLAAGLGNAGAYAAERKRAESLAALDRAKTAFFSNVSHELRTPLTLMLGPLGGMLADPDVPAQLHGELAIIQRNGLRLLKQVNTMLDFSRIEAGRATAQFVATDLAQLTSDLASVFRAATDKAGLALRVDCPPLGRLVRVDRDMWEKIVLNLISNAFKFTLDGEIAVALALAGDHVELVVRDTGTGIPAGELDRVFERFHRVEGSKSRTHEGTGIGLALVQELVRLHGGTIRVASELGRGTAFTVSLPLAVEAAAASAVIAGDHAGPGSGPNAFVEEALRWLPDVSEERTPVVASADRAHVLVADDNADMRDYLRRLLAVRWDVATVSNGRQALAAIQRRRPELVISDVMMPELDGLGLVGELRGRPELRELPVILLSARAGEEARIEGLRAGASDYLYKPFTSRELLARVDNQLMLAALRTTERAHTQYLQTVFEQAPVAIAILRGPDHVFEIANTPYRRIFGDRDVIGKPLADALPEVVAQGFTALLDQVYRTGEPFIGTGEPVQLRRGDGDGVEDLFFDLIFQPLIERGAVIGVAAIVHEVTALATARRDAELANRAKDEFLAMLGHELRNPLAPITTALDLMRVRPGVGGERERAVIERQVRHLVGLVDDLLDVSRITRGKVELRPEPVELADVVARSVELASPLLEEHHHALEVDVARGLVVHGDPARLAQVVSNLLTNAAKYTPPTGRIEVTAWRDGASLVVRVADNGIGIEPAMLRRVFEPFAQERQSIDRARGGLGLGLAIVDNLVKLHGGTVTATSAGRDQGSQFTVSLPALEGVPVVAAAAPERAAPTGEARILIIDDNVDAAQLLADVLAAGGYRTLAAHDGPSALAVIDSFQPQLAVVDLGLPVMDGYELARHLLARPASTALQLVALTGYGQPKDRERTSAAGFAAHLVKPVDIAQLRQVIERLLPAR
jgi:signal transduction histidine kinase